MAAGGSGRLREWHLRFEEDNVKIACTMLSISAVGGFYFVVVETMLRTGSGFSDAGRQTTRCSTVDTGYIGKKKMDTEY
jgi:hypothetical protein